MISPANTWKWWGYPNFSLLGILPTNTCFSDVKQIPKPGHLPSPEAPSWLRGQTSAAWRPWLSPRKRQRWCHPWRLPRQSATKTMEIGGFLGHDVKMLVLHVFFSCFFFVSISVDWRLLGFIHVVETMIFLCTSKYIVFIPWTIVFFGKISFHPILG